MGASFHLLFFFIAVVLSDEQPKLRYYHGNFNDYTELPLNEAQAIFSTSWYDASKTTVIFAHGFKGYPNGPAVTAVINAYLYEGGSNVALLNWEGLAAAITPSIASSYLNWAAPNARKVGLAFAETLLTLSTAGLNINNTHLIGHSLGAQIFGIAGNKLLEKGTQLPWITGLDPAGVGFETRPLSVRLNPRSAGFVSVIHTDPSKYGIKSPCGTVDFWPNFRNGQVIQPGCPKGSHATFSPEDLCNHNKCWEMLIDSLKYPGTILGSHAPNYRRWKKYSDKERVNNVLEIGAYRENVVPGNYYLTTNEESPFGLGTHGL